MTTTDLAIPDAHLTDLAHQFRRAADAAALALKDGVGHYIAAGEILLALRDAHQRQYGLRGGWELFVSRQTGYSARSCATFCEFARNKKLVLANANATTIRAVQRVIRAASPKAKAKPKPPANDDAKRIRRHPARIIQGDFRQTKLPADSADMVFADPPYSRDSLGLFDDLGEWAERTLRPGGWMTTYCPTMFLPEVVASLTPHLAYHWTFAIELQRGSRLSFAPIENKTRLVLVFSKGVPGESAYSSDHLTGSGKEKDAHQWQQGRSEADHLIRTFSRPGQTVIDPMAGSGTAIISARELGRRAIGVDIDPAAVKTIRERLG